MLNISKNRIDQFINREQYSALGSVESRDVSNFLLRLIIVFMVVAILSLFLPWTQNIRSNGYVNTLYPEERPQSVQALVGGKIERWYVREGDTLSKGDTLLVVSESKQEYMDPDLISRLQSQITSNEQTITAYADKVSQLDRQYEALSANLQIKLSQNKLKIEQTMNKIAADSTALIAAKVLLDNTTKQLDRTKELFAQGIKSLTDLENKESDLNKYVAKVNEIENKIRIHLNHIDNLENESGAISADYDTKLAKLLSDKQSVRSDQFKADINITKLESDKTKVQVRAQNYVIRSPIDGIVTKTLRSGIGEIIKEGEKVVSLVPTSYQVSVEIYVKPMDMPLLALGQRVRIQFDGWPAIVFSGWPDNSYGTFGGVVFAIDNDISDNGLYRVLVSQDSDDEPWPEQVRIGGGANALILLNDVRLYYELWRQLNGFPADFYRNEKDKEAKSKAPIRKFK